MIVTPLVQLYNERNHTVDEICQMMEISKPTLYSYVREAAPNRS